jgi:hypothetical protein
MSKQKPITRYWERYAVKPPYEQVDAVVNAEDEEPYVTPSLDDLLQRPERTALDIAGRTPGKTVADIEAGYTPPSLSDVITGKHKPTLGD